MIRWCGQLTIGKVNQAIQISDEEHFSCLVTVYIDVRALVRVCVCVCVALDQ